MSVDEDEAKAIIVVALVAGAGAMIGFGYGLFRIALHLKAADEMGCELIGIFGTIFGLPFLVCLLISAKVAIREGWHWARVKLSDWNQRQERRPKDGPYR